VNKSDQYRAQLVESIITTGNRLNNRLDLSFDGNNAVYTEILPLDEIVESTNNFKTHKTINGFLENFIHRVNPIFEAHGFIVNEDELNINTTNFYDGYEINIPLIKENYDPILELFNEIDGELNTDLNNKASNVPITKEPFGFKTPNLPIIAKKEKTQNPKKVDLILKTVFENKFKNYELSTDAGKWKAIKTLKDDGKLAITWESKKDSSILIETIIFPNDTNKVTITVKNRQGDIFLTHYLEIYRIPTDEFLAEKFFRKTLFNQLKKYIDSNVIQIDPFKYDYIFWKTDNPSFSYSFSTPNKNKIILDLISFISTAKKPILDDFFEANNLKHKQGYLQTLLDSAEAAGIFKFKREGNEILILRGPNYKSFLQGKLRRVMS